MTTKTLDIETYVTRRRTARVLHVSLDNLAEAAALSGGRIFSWEHNREKGEPHFVLESDYGRIKVKVGMWLVNNGRGWIGMSDYNFQKKYETSDIPVESVEVTIEEPQGFNGKSRTYGDVKKSVEKKTDDVDDEVARIKAQFGW